MFKIEILKDGRRFESYTLKSVEDVIIVALKTLLQDKKMLEVYDFGWYDTENSKVIYVNTKDGMYEIKVEEVKE